MKNRLLYNPNLKMSMEKTLKEHELLTGFEIYLQQFKNV